MKSDTIWREISVEIQFEESIHLRNDGIKWRIFVIVISLKLLLGPINLCPTPRSYIWHVIFGAVLMFLAFVST